MKDMKHYWGDVTDPAQHDAGDYRYLTHAVRHSNLKMLDGFLRDLKCPEARDFLLKTSLIDNHRPYVFRSVGLVLGVRKENILITSPNNFSSNEFNKAELEGLSLKCPKFDPGDLLARTGLCPGRGSSVNNEIIIHSKSVDVLGVFVQAICYPLAQHKIQRVAEKYNLPCVQIPKATHRPALCDDWTMATYELAKEFYKRRSQKSLCQDGTLDIG